MPDLANDFMETDGPEEWRPCLGFEGYYEISNHGRVRSLIFANKQTRQRRTVPLFLKPWRHAKFYWAVALSIHGKRIPKLVHHLVLDAFVGPRPKEHECLHGLRGPGVNALSNLRWGTSKENKADSLEAGTFQRGAKHYRALLSVDQVREIKAKAGTIHPKTMAAEYGVSTSTIKNIVNGYNWKHIQ